jgi:hypothetical protein
MMFPFALIMLPLSVAIDTIRFPADIWMEARTGPDDPTDRIPVCLCKKESAQKGFPAKTAPRTSSLQMID